MRHQLTSVQDDSQEEWVPEEELETLDRAKLLGLRICTHRALGLARHADAVEIAKPTFDLIASVFANDGQINEQTGEG
jgi:sister-chromatid-cohesion protein PDS5